MTVEAVINFKCCLCGTWKGERHIAETIFVNGNEEPIQVCDACDVEAEKSHKFSGTVARALYEDSLDFNDDAMSQEGWGWCCLHGEWIITEDTQGFVDATHYPTHELARKEFDRIYDDGMGYTEDDIVIQYDWRVGGYEVWVEGKRIATVNQDTCRHDNYLRRARAVASLHMRKHGWHPNVWLAEERGSIRRIEVW